MIPPTSEQEAKIAELAEIHDSVQVRMMGPADRPTAWCLCWERRINGALYLVEEFYIYADGKERRI